MDTVKRYDSSFVKTDRWERAGMDIEPDGDYVEYDDYLALKKQFEESEKEASYYRWLTDGKRGDYCWNNVLSQKDRDSGETLEEVIEKAIIREGR